MMILDLSQLLDDSKELDSQIKFCDLMAKKTAPHDRDISQMYQSITETLKKLEAPEPLTTRQHDPIFHSLSNSIT